MTSPATRDPGVPDLGTLIEHRRILGMVLVFGPGVLGAGALALGVVTGIGVLAAAGAYLVAALAVLLVLRRRVGRRIRARDAGVPPDEGPGRVLAAVLAVFLAAAAEGWSHWLARVGPVWALGAPPAPWLTAAVPAGAALAGAAVLALFARFYATTPVATLPEARGVAAWLRGGFWMLVLAGGALLARGRAEGVEPVVLRIQVALLAVVAFELLALAALARRRGRLAPARPVSLRLVASRLNPLASVFAYLTEAFGIDLRGTWALHFMQRSLLPLALVLGLVGWLATAFTMVSPTERGVLETFGARADAPLLEPGMHLVWPWPIQRVWRVDVERVRSIPIGFQGDKAGTSLLWTASHAAEEYNLLLGDGRDLVSVNGALHYKVGDVLEYAYATADPETGLAVAADRVLMRETVGRTLDGVLSENLTALAEAIERDIQAEADARRLGIQVVDFTLMGLHPPRMVAEEYQAVVGAQIERDTRVLEAEAYREEAVPVSHGEAARLRHAASADKADQLARARGEAAAFGARLESYRAAPELFVFRRLLEARERQLEERRFAVIDDRIEREGGALWTTGSAGEPDEDR